MSEAIAVGIIGTGYAASRRAESLQGDFRSSLQGVVGYSAENCARFAREYNIRAYDRPEELLEVVDAVAICNANSQHGDLVCQALERGKHVIVEYPLALDLEVARRAIALAKDKDKLLHVEHIELLGGLHEAIRSHLPEIGEVVYARYITLMPQREAPQRWTYHRELFGFPLSGALSRLHRLIDLFGKVATVSCSARFWEVPGTSFYRACLCNALLRFDCGVVAEVVYGKGETFWSGARTFELHGDRGTLHFSGETGMLIRGEEQTLIPVGSRRGLFAKDTQWVLDHLTSGTPLYVDLEQSAYAVEVADAARRSALSGETISISS